jgi:serine/threonine-protein phosphatase 5
MATPTSDEDLRNSISSMITGTEDEGTSSSSSSTPYDDDLTPFPSPVLSATSLAGLSRE